MFPATFAYMTKVLEEVIELENDKRSGFVYSGLAIDMAKAAKLVYDACVIASEFTQDEME